MTARKLRAVEDGEKSTAPRSMTVAAAAKEGTELELLMAMRDRVATAVADPNCPARDLAALTRRLREIAKDIEALQARAREEAADAADAPDEAWDEEAI
jgi:DNA-binding NarL/FixJ family response regulator